MIADSDAVDVMVQDEAIGQCLSFVGFSDPGTSCDNYRELPSTNEIRRKRHFSEVSTGPETGSLSLVGEKRMELQSPKHTQAFKRPPIGQSAAK